MNSNTMDVYAEIDKVLSLMDPEVAKEIPENVRNMFKSQMNPNHQIDIDVNIPLKDQITNPDTLAMLAVINYKYLIKDYNKKSELLKLYAKNEQARQEELRKNYNPDDIFTKREQQKEAQRQISYMNENQSFLNNINTENIGSKESLEHVHEVKEIAPDKLDSSIMNKEVHENPYAYLNPEFKDAYKTQEQINQHVQEQPVQEPVQQQVQQSTTIENANQPVDRTVTKEEAVSLMEYPKPWYRRLFDKIKSIFGR